ncbi:MAG TPA: Ni/Fe-hydrogenase cytochrome b subunit [Candidatus Methylomirabilis sp.]|nr:Ni/Fe-hydrogenase cytochrome b subunit [Candidatus Methylomirabilis sp.]
MKSTFRWRDIGLGTGLLVLVAAFGFILALYRFALGIGSVSNLNQGYPWGFWIGFDVLAGIALAAGGFVVAGLMHMFGGEKYHPLVRPTILTAFLGYLLFILALMVDLGRPWTIWHMIIYWHHESPMFEVGWCVMMYTTILFLEFLPVVFERYRMDRLYGLWMNLAPWIAIALLVLFAIALTHSAPWVIAIAAVLAGFELLTRFGLIHRDPRMPTMLLIAGIMFSVLHQSSLGSLFLIVPHKLNHIWYSPMLPVLFFFSAVAAGVAMVIVESTLSARYFGRRVEVVLLSDVGHVLTWAILAYMALRSLDLVLRGVGTELLVVTPQSIAFWIEVVVGLMIPLAILLTPEFANSATWLFWSSIMVILGLLINRLNVAVVGITSVYGETYYPHWMEVAITAGLVALGVLAYLYVCRNFPVLAPERPHTAPA